MQRLIVFCARRANFSHRIRYFSSEIDIEAKYFQKGPLDPEAVDLVKSYNDKIVYSSYVERNKRPMRFAEKMMTKKMCEKEKRRAAYREAMRRPFSLALKHTADVLETSVFQEPKNELPKPNENTDENMDLSGERDINRNIIMNESKLEIFREMNRRRNELENIQPKYPTKWMSDYETYDEKEDEDEFSDAQFGTPGNFEIDVAAKLVHLFFLFSYQIVRCRFQKFLVTVAVHCSSVSKHHCLDICRVN